MILAMTMLATTAVAAAPAPNKTMGADSWHAFTVQSVSPVSSDGASYLQVAAGDVNGDGVADAVVIKLACGNSASPFALWRMTGPRGVASAQPTGTAPPKPWMHSKEWGPAPAAWSSLKSSYAMKSPEGVRLSSPRGDGWSSVGLSNAAEMCAALRGEVTATK